MIGTISNRPPEFRRYTYRILMLLTLYALFVILAETQMEAIGSPAVALSLAVAPALPIIGIFVAIGSLLARLRDEYVRMLLVRQTLVATGFALSVTTVWGFLELYAGAPHIEVFWVAPLWFAGLGVGGMVNWFLESRGESS